MNIAKAYVTRNNMNIAVIARGYPLYVPAGISAGDGPFGFLGWIVFAALFI